MKTTVEISDSLLREVRRAGSTRRRHSANPVERGLHHVLSETKHRAPFKLRRATFKRGLVVVNPLLAESSL